MKNIVFSILIFAISQSAWSAFNPEYLIWATASGQKWGVDPALIMAVMATESSYFPDVVSKTGARGLMQLMPETAKHFGVKDAFDPEQNIEGGTRYLKYLLDRFDNNTQLAVAAYNAGENNVRKYKGVPPFTETRNYVKRVADYFNMIHSTGTVPEVEPIIPKDHYDRRKLCMYQLPGTVNDLETETLLTLRDSLGCM